MFDRNIVFLDLETTGGSTFHDRIIEVGLIEVDRGRVVGEWSSVVNPGRRIPHGIQTLTGIADEAIARAPRFEDIAPSLLKRLEGRVLAAHNARFDYGFLKAGFRRLGLAYTAPVLCTVRLSRRLFPQHERHNLDALLVRHAIFCLDRHRAMGDAQVLWQLAQHWRRDFGDAALSEACAELLKRPPVPAGLPEDLYDELPERPGVYVFHGDGGEALYVGRSANVRARVIAHFCGPRRAARDAQLAQDVKRVECIETTGELGAYLRCAELRRRLAPRHSGARRHADALCAWQWDPARPTSAPALVETCEVEPDDDLYGLFRSRGAARAALRELAGAHGLCRRALGLETGEAHAPCSAHQCGKCRGLCIGAEPPLRHAMRVMQALASLRVRPWPFAGPVAVRERDPDSARAELHVVDRWRYLGTAHGEGEAHALAASRGAALEPEMYRLLRRVILAPPRGCDIVPLEKRAVRASYATEC